MKTQYYTATALDGFIATVDDPLEWLFSLGDLASSSYPAFIAEVGALAMGSATYLWMVRYAETMTSETGSAWPYQQPAWVFSHRELPTIAGAHVRFVYGDVRPVHREMRAAAGSKNIWIVGGRRSGWAVFRRRAPGRTDPADRFGYSRPRKAAVPAPSPEPDASPGFGKSERVEHGRASL